MSADENVVATSFALQPNVRLRLIEVVEIGVAAGPAIAIVNAVPSSSSLTATRSRSTLGLALSGRVRTYLAGRLTAELRANYAAYLPKEEPRVDYVIQPPERNGQSVREWSWSLGLGYAVSGWKDE